MRRKPIVVTLCGSTKFKEEFLKWNRDLTLAGAIVLMPGVFHHSGDPMSEAQGVAIRKLHMQKILMSDLIFVVNKDNYIGQATAAEIEMAKTFDIPVIYCYNNTEEDVVTYNKILEELTE